MELELIFSLDTILTLRIINYLYFLVFKMNILNSHKSLPMKVFFWQNSKTHFIGMSFSLCNENVTKIIGKNSLSFNILCNVHSKEISSEQV